MLIGFALSFNCLVCNCDAEGTARDICDPNTGVCICMKNFAGPRCEICSDGYFRFPACIGRFNGPPSLKRPCTLLAVFEFHVYNTK